MSTIVAATARAAELCGLRPYLVRLARSRVRDRDAAEDLVQETLVAACAGVARFEGRSTLRTWVAGILLHKLMDAFRARSREALAIEDAEPPEDPDFGPDGRWRSRVDPWTNPALALERKRFREALDAAVDRLPEMQSRAYRLRELEGLESAQICAALGVTEGNLFVLLHRARLNLRRSLDRDWFAHGH